MSQRGEGWAVGDLALCVKQGRWTDGQDGPNVGQINNVTLVSLRPGTGKTYLGFADWPECDVFYEAPFRKINPHTPDSFDHEVIEQMAGLPVGVE